VLTGNGRDRGATPPAMSTCSRMLGHCYVRDVASRTRDNGRYRSLGPDRGRCEHRTRPAETDRIRLVGARSASLRLSASWQLRARAGCLTEGEARASPRVLVPQRLPRPGSAGNRRDSGAGCMSRAANMVSVEGPSRDLDSAVELLEHVGATQLLATVHQPSVTQGDRPDGRTVREGGAPWCRLDRISGFPGHRKAQRATSLADVCAARVSRTLKEALM